MSTLELNLFKVLKKELNLPDEKAIKVVKAFNETIVEKITTSNTVFKSEMKEDFQMVYLTIEKEIALLRKDMHQDKTDMLKWIVATIIGSFLANVAAIVGILAFYLSYIR